MRMVIGSRCALFDAPEELLRELRQSLSLENPAYFQALKRSPNGRIFMSRYLKYYEEKNGIFYCGRGLEERVHAYCGERGIELEFSERTSRPVYPTTSTIKLRPYQEGVPEDVIMGASHGVVKMATGAGKSIVALRIAELLRTTALFIVPKKSIMQQFANDIEKYFGAKPGIIGEGKFDVQPFTVATIQTLQRMIPKMRKEDLAHLSSYYGAVFVDECHTVIPAKSRTVIEAFAPERLYGLTATDRRGDGQGEAIRFVFGENLCDVRVDQAVPSVRIARYAGRIPMGEYADIIEYQTNDYERNKLVASVVAEQASQGRRVLVLCKRVAHCEGLSGMLKDLRVIALKSDANGKETADTVARIRDGSLPFDCVVGTFSLLSAGTDFPSLDTLVFAGDVKSDILQEQSIGRVRRLFEGKKDPLIVDVQDSGNFILARQAKARNEFYKAQGWVITQS